MSGHKKSLRNTLLDKRAEYEPTTRRLYDELALKNLMQSDAYRASKRIFTFISFGEEISTHALIRESISRGLEVYVPITERGNPHMRLSRLRSMDDLILGHYGILTPHPDALEFADPNAPDLVIVPGLAFDAGGYRLGYGGGFYDRYFSSLTSDPVKLGYCYSFQLVEQLPHESHDIPVDRVITEKQEYGGTE